MKPPYNPQKKHKNIKKWIRLDSTKNWGEEFALARWYKCEVKKMEKRITVGVMRKLVKNLKTSKCCVAYICINVDYVEWEQPAG